MSTCVIYSIYFEEIDNKYYIGCSTDIKRRFENHLSELKNNRHINYKLQESYNLGHTPVFSIIEEVCANQLYEREVYWINRFDSFHSGFNLTPGGIGAGIGENHPKAKYSKEIYVGILKELANTNKTYNIISKEFFTTYDTVKNIAHLKCHTYLKDEFPIEYSILENKFGNRGHERKCAKDLGIVYPKIISPDGNIHNILNLSEFTREYNLDKGNLSKLLRGENHSHKGWKLYNESSNTVS